MAGAAKTYRFGDVTVACSSIDRPIFPDDGITKGDLIAYYADVAEVMVPELLGRPLSMVAWTSISAGLVDGHDGFLAVRYLEKLLAEPDRLGL